MLTIIPKKRIVLYAGALKDNLPDPTVRGGGARGKYEGPRSMSWISIRRPGILPTYRYPMTRRTQKSATSAVLSMVFGPEDARYHGRPNDPRNRSNRGMSLAQRIIQDMAWWLYLQTIPLKIQHGTGHHPGSPARNLASDPV